VNGVIAVMSVAAVGFYLTFLVRYSRSASLNSSGVNSPRLFSLLRILCLSNN
jgi:hypothetical protein